MGSFACRNMGCMQTGHHSVSVMVKRCVPAVAKQAAHSTVMLTWARNVEMI